MADVVSQILMTPSWLEIQFSQSLSLLVLLTAPTLTRSRQDSHYEPNTKQTHPFLTRLNLNLCSDLAVFC